MPPKVNLKRYTSRSKLDHICRRHCYKFGYKIHYICRRFSGVGVHWILLAMVLSHLLQFTVSDYPFGIFNLFLEQVLDKFVTWGNRKCSFIQADITYYLSLEIQTQSNSTTLSKGIERSQQLFRPSHLDEIWNDNAILTKSARMPIKRLVASAETSSVKKKVRNLYLGHMECACSAWNPYSKRQKR